MKTTRISNLSKEYPFSFKQDDLFAYIKNGVAYQISLNEIKAYLGKQKTYLGLDNIEEDCEFIINENKEHITGAEFIQPL